MAQDEIPDYYEILGVRPSATAEEITRAYRKAMRAAHPDGSGTTGLFRVLKIAYGTLRDPVSRAAYDSRRTAPPPSPAEPPPSPADGRPRRSGGTTTMKPERQPEPGIPIKVRPRFGTHWAAVAAIACTAVAALIAVYELWPAGVPADLYLLLAMPVAAAPMISQHRALGARIWSWAACVVPFSMVAVLSLSEAGQRIWTLGAALGGLVMAGAGAAAAPHLVRHGRRLDRLVDRGSVGYQIFNVPGAGLDSRAAGKVARISAGRLERLAEFAGVRMVHGLVAPDSSGSGRCYVDHAVLRDRRLAVVMVRRWPGETYTWSYNGTLTANGRPFPGGDTGVAAAVRAFREVVPYRVRVRGFVVVLPAEPADAPRLDFGSAAAGDLFVGTLAQVHDQLAAWLGGTRPVVRRRVFAAVLPFVCPP